MIKKQLNILIHLASADGHIGDHEKKLIKMIGAAHGINEDEIENMMAKPQPVEDLHVLTPDEKFEYLYNIVQLMKADRQVFKSEIVFCQDIAQKLGFKPGVIGEISKYVYSDPSITGDREKLKEKVAKYTA